MHLSVGKSLCMFEYQLSVISEAAYTQGHSLHCLGYATFRLIYPLA